MSRQWRPEGKPSNCCLPRELRNAEDYFSPAGWRVIEAMTIKAPPGFTTREKDQSWRTKGSYGNFSARARVCEKTARNTIAEAIQLGLVLILEKRMNGGQRVETHYIVRPFGSFLAAIRANPAYFHTANGHTVGVGRKPHVFTPAEAAEWKINPNAPPPPRFYGPLPTAPETQRSRRPAPATPLDLEMVIAAFYRANIAGDAAGNELAGEAIAAARRIAADIPGEIVAELILAIAGAYKTNAKYPKPTGGWFLKKLPEYAASWARNEPEPRARTG